MKSKLALCAVFCLLYSLLSAQGLETTIYLPDSLGGTVGPQCLAYNPVNNRIYVGGAGVNCVIAIDGATNLKAARIAAGRWVKALCCNPSNDKVYCANESSASVTVIDGAADSAIATVAVGVRPYALCYNPDQQSVLREQRQLQRKCD